MINNIRFYLRMASIACFIVVISLILQIVLAKNIEIQAKKDIDSIETVEVKEPEELRLSTLKHMFDINGVEYYEATFISRDSGLIKCSIPKNKESLLEEGAIYKAEVSSIYIKSEYNAEEIQSYSIQDTRLKSVEAIEFIFSDYIDYDNSDVKLSGDTNKRVTKLKENYIDKNVVKSLEEIATKMNLAVTLWIIISALLFISKSLNIKVEKS